MLDQTDLEVVAIPYRPQGGGGGGIPTASGNWANFLRVGKLIVVPSFGLAEDDLVLGLLRERLPALSVIALNCRHLAEEGRLIDCVTWQISRASNLGR